MSSTHVALIIQAIKASGTIVRVEAAEFLAIVGRTDEPLVVVTHGGVFMKRFQYLTAYKGLAFHTKTLEALELPRGVEVVQAESIWIPA